MLLVDFEEHIYIFTFHFVLLGSFSAAGGTSNAEGGQNQIKRRILIMLCEYGVKLAMQQQELSEADGQQIIECSHDAELLQDNAKKHARFKKLLLMKFGPSKGKTVHELVISDSFLRVVHLCVDRFCFFFADAKKDGTNASNGAAKAATETATARGPEYNRRFNWCCIQ